MQYHINDLPDEILENILNLIPGYKFLRQCKLVCKRWVHSVKRVIEHKEVFLQTSTAAGSLEWKKLPVEDEEEIVISPRHSHSVATYENWMYVFGGCAGTSTTFNDLWKYDLDTNKWERPMPMGNYPSPKACATMVYYNHTFVLFGGWAHPSTRPPHQRRKLFRELHVYDIKSNRWTAINTLGGPPPTSAHSASIHGNMMVVIGGVSIDYSSSNDIWCLNLDTYTWHKQATTDLKPHPRYGHSQVVLDKKHILILGGCTGPNAAMNDAWILTMEGPVWTWRRISMNSPDWAPTRIWCHQACKIGNHVVVLGEKKKSSGPMDMSIAAKLACQPTAPARPVLQLPPHPRHQRVEPRIDRDENVNGRHGRFITRSGPFKNRIFEVAGPSRFVGLPSVVIPIELKWYGELAVLNPPIENRNRSVNRQRQLESLRRMEEKIQQRHARQKMLKRPRDKFAIYSLDIEHVLEDECLANWVTHPGELHTGPDVRILYSLVVGQGELIVFGGIRKELTSFQGPSDDGSEVYNEVFLIQPPLCKI